jgi:hypothetical protein
MNIKKFFDDYGYTILKLLGTHVAMSVFGLMVWLPTGNNWLIGSILGVLCVIFYFFMVNNDVAKVGSKDAVRKVYGKPAAHPAKGFIIGAVSAIPDFIICTLYIIFSYFGNFYPEIAEAAIVFTFTGTLWEGIFMGMVTLTEQPRIVFACIPFVIILFSGISYILGMKNINIIPLEANPEEEERRRLAEKEKKKNLFSKQKQKDEEEEDELM